MAQIERRDRNFLQNLRKARSKVQLRREKEEEKEEESSDSEYEEQDNKRSRNKQEKTPLQITAQCAGRGTSRHLRMSRIQNLKSKGTANFYGILRREHQHTAASTIGCN